MKNNLEIKNSDYSLWKDELINQIHLRQLKTVININSDTLNNYFEIGKQILAAQNEKGWGSHVIDQLSVDLEKEFGKGNGYSVRNLRNMKIFAEEYPDFPVWKIPISDLNTNNTIRQAALAELQKTDEFVQVPLAQITWYHHITVDGDDYYIDLLMYHTRLHCYVVIELKAVEFIPEFVSKLNFYISAIDDQLKMPEDKPTIGLLLCRSKSNVKAEYSLRGITQPLGIAEYEIQKVIEEIRSSIPCIEELENEN